MSATREGTPAFPTSPNTQPGFYKHHGMSLRDWFAGQALLGMYQRMRPTCTEYEANAYDAYAQADAMLKAREITR